MTDELDALGQTNPIQEDTTPGIEAAVALDRQELFDLLAEGDRTAPRRRRPARPRFGAKGTRIGYAGALAAAAGVVVAIVLVGAEDPALDREPIEGATDGSAVTSPTSPTDPVPPSTTLEVVVSTPEEAGTETTVGETTSTSVAPTTTADAPTDGTTPPRSEGPFDPAVDLLSIHFDFSNPDDGHATVAAKELTGFFGIEPHVVSGTADPDSTVFVNPYGPVMDAAWGAGWVDAGSDRSEAVVTTSQRWLATIEAGGRVWVAEGGVSDFTAAVVDEIRRRRPGLATEGAVLVVQHNGRNESASKAGALATVQDVTEYTRIDDGNSANGTADLFQPSSSFEAAALAGPNAAAWAVAFGDLPAAELDFSDTVEVLHILGVGLDQVATPDDFADRFLG